MNPFEVGGTLAELYIGLNVYLPGPAEEVKVVDVERTEVDLQRVDDVAHGKAHRLRRVSVDVQIQPGCIGTKAGEDVAKLPFLIGARNQVAASRFEFARAGCHRILDDQLEAARVAEAIHWRRPQDGDDRSRHGGREFIAQLGCNGIGGSVRRKAAGELVEHHVERTEIRRVRAEQGRLTRNADRVLDAGNPSSG